MRQRITDTDTLTVTLRHPLNGIVSVAVLLESWIVDGHIIGLVLQFPDGHTASLTYPEIHALERGGDEAQE